MAMQKLIDLNGKHIDKGYVGWTKNPYGVRLPEDPGKMFNHLLEQEAFAIKGEKVDVNTEKYIDQWFTAINLSADSVPMDDKKTGDESPVDSETGGKLQLYNMPNYTDTRVGGNDAINPYWQFNRDDDIVPNLLVVPNVSGGGEDYGMGRVYSERYDSLQQILWLCMGVAEFTDLISFYIDAGDGSAAEVMNKGSIFGLGAKVLQIALKGTIWAFTFPIVAPFWLYRWLKRVDGHRVTKYYWFLPSMTLYYEFINTMLSYLAVGMGIYPLFMAKRMDHTKVLSEETIAEKGYDNYSATFDGWGQNLNNVKYANETGIPELLQDGPDIFVIMNRRARAWQKNREKITTRELLLATNTEESARRLFSKYGEKYTYELGKEADAKPIWTKVAGKASEKAKNLYSNIKSTMFGAGDFVGFRIERSSNASESISNETGPTSIASKLNSIAQQARDEYEDSMGGNVIMRMVNNLVGGEDVGSALSKVAKGIAVRTGASLASAVGVGDIGAILTHGNGFLDIPDVWKNSSFNKSYSFTIDLYARYGDPVSIYQSIYIPLVLLLGASLPRAIGSSMYTSPFLIKAFCKGQFAIPCGMVSSIDITRGKEEHGWSNNMLPTQVSVNISLKDMTPAMFMGMQDIGLFDTMSRNENLHEYLDTLSALGISERLYILPQALRKASAALLIRRNTMFSSTYWSTRMGRSGLLRAYAYLTPFGNQEKTDLRKNAAALRPF